MYNIQNYVYGGVVDGEAQNSKLNATFCGIFHAGLKYL